MTLEVKVGQMTQTERYQVYDDATQITTWHLGALLSGGGSTPTPNTPQAWADMVDRFQSAALATRLHIPLLYGIDTVHGDGNIYGATVFPHNIGLGATQDPALVSEVEHVSSRWRDHITITAATSARPVVGHDRSQAATATPPAVPTASRRKRPGDRQRTARTSAAGVRSAWPPRQSPRRRGRPPSSC